MTGSVQMRSHNRWSNLLIVAGIAVFAAALWLSDSAPPSDEVTTNHSLPAYVPPVPIPPENVLTAAKVTLGRHLFYDSRLSFNQTIACGSCHEQARAFTDGKRVSSGATGALTRRNAMTLTNVAFNAALTWADDTVVTLEQQALIPLMGLHPIEMGMTGHEAKILLRFSEHEQYRAMFEAAFPSAEPAVSIDTIVQALASFQRTMTSYDAPYDRYLAGDNTAMSDLARRGMDLFFSPRLNCFRCHGGHNFRFTLGHRRDAEDTSVAFHNTGLYNIDGNGAYPEEDRGLIEVSGRADDMGKFKTPTLRNVAVTAPYMHDGSSASLDDVIAHYARGGRQILDGPLAGDGRRNPLKSDLIGGFEISADDRSALLAFLQSLTDASFLERQVLAKPATLPE